MSTISGYHRYLFLGKVTGTLSESEKEELEKFFSENDKAEQEYILFVKGLSDTDVSDSYTKLNDPGFWRDLPGEAKERQIKMNRKMWMKRSSIAVGAIVVIFLSWSIWNSFTKDQKISIAKKENKKIELRLANGKVIDLTSNIGLIEESDIRINNQEKTLTYSTTHENNGVNSIVVPVGMDYQVVLNDGTKIWLNSMTKLDFPTKFSGAKREITISGEAYLEVAKSKNNPFIIHLPQAQVEVVGTSFNVNNYEEGSTKVALVEGSVNLLTKDSSYRIKPGFQINYNSQGKINQQQFDSKRVLSWRKGLFYFDITSLNEISQVLERWYGVKTMVDNPSILKKKFVGVVNKSEPITVFLDNLRIISKVDSYFDASGVLHFK